MSLKVTSVAKRPENLFSAPAAISVLTGEDIRRLGATSIPDALRYVPGLEVAQIDGHTWAITARGFNSMFSDKLLVLIDGRAVYTPLFAGVFWDVQDTLLEDIDRIEVVRGPGGSLWGANAVNGVINIVTKSARDTQGWFAQAGAGTEVAGFGSAQFGGKLDADTFYRVFSKYSVERDQADDTGHDAGDHWNQGRGGFRIDSYKGGDNLLTLQGDLYTGTENEWRNLPFNAAPVPYQPTVSDQIRVGGGNLLGRWTHTLADGGETALQIYYDRTYRRMLGMSENRNTFDVDFQHRWPLCDWDELIWGGGYRWTRDEVPEAAVFSIMGRDTLNLVNGFVQNELTLVPKTLKFTAGVKVEHTDFDHCAVEPTGRLAWTPTERQTVWAAVSRAVRTPAQSDREMQFNTAYDKLPANVITQFQGNPEFVSETVVAYELGYRIRPVDRLTFDLAGFYNVYRDLRSIQMLSSGVVIPLQIDNMIAGESYGVELESHWQVLDCWQLHAGYTFLDLQLHTERGSTDSDREEGDTPQHQFSLRSTVNLPAHVEFDCGVRWVDSVGNDNIPSYVVGDVRVGWRPTKNWMIELVGQNLFDDHHPEFSSLFTVQRTQVEQSMFGRVTWRY